MGVHPANIQSAAEYARKCGCPTDFDSLGRPILKTLRHQRKFAQSIGYANYDDIEGGSNTRYTKEDFHAKTYNASREDALTD